jgi:hypothetical protein
MPSLPGQPAAAVLLPGHGPSRHSSGRISGDSGPDRTPGLAAAVAAIVAIAAQRALANGEFAALRALIDRVLDAAEPQVENDAEDDRLPMIADADAPRERDRLAALLARQRG